MLLRAKLSLFGIAVVLAINILVVLAAFQRENLIRRQFSEQIISDQTNLWSQIIDDSVDAMEDHASIMLNYQELADSLLKYDAEKLRQIGTEVFQQLQSQNIADRFELIARDGTLAYSSQTGLFRSSIIHPSAVQRAIFGQSDIRGIANDKQRNIAVVFGAPLRTDNGQVAGLGIMATDISRVLTEFERINNSRVIIVNRRGRLLTMASDTEQWANYKSLIDLNNLEETQTLEIDDHYYSVSVLPQVSELGGLSGLLVNIKDVTEFVLQQRKISTYIAVIILLFLLVSLLGLYFYMRRTLTPLSEGVNVLEALSRGDVEVQIEHATGNDEIGQISNAVSVFRNSFLSFFRYRRSRERQRARQERFIYREMKQLVNTLDEGEDRDALQSELEHLGSIVQQQTNQKSANGSFSSMEFEVSDSKQRSRDSDSLALMAAAFQGMSDRVRNQHDRLREALATKETLIALRNELDIARRVQLSLLPGDIKKSDAFDIAGGMWPAKEVGGDFLDYFRLDDSRVGLAIADVSGKGVPAALFTVMARTLLRNTVTYMKSPGKVLESVNQFLERNNSEQLFVTYFYGILDEASGIFTYTNCGHNPPILLDDNGARFLPTTNGMVLAMFGDLEFEDACVQLNKNSRIIMYTDGITEAFNAEGEAYGDDRLLEIIGQLPTQSPQDDVNFIVDEVNKFVQDAPQFDDMACVVLQFNKTLSDEQVKTMQSEWKVPQSRILELEVKPQLSELPKIATEIEFFANHYKWPASWITKATLSVDELFTNIVNYGMQDQENPSDILVWLRYVDGVLTIVLEDKGVEFNPFAEVETPSLDEPLEERQIGGLGVYFVKTLMDEVKYERIDGTNRITLSLSSDQ